MRSSQFASFAIWLFSIFFTGKLLENAANQIPTRIFKPDWQKSVKRAGIGRNLEMVKAADAVIAIWDGQGKDTKSSTDFSGKENKPFYVLKMDT